MDMYSKREDSRRISDKREETSMKYVYHTAVKYRRYMPINPARAYLLICTAGWFLAGAVSGGIVARLFLLTAETARTAAVTAASLTGMAGYVCSALWLARHAGEDTLKTAEGAHRKGLE